MTHRPVLAPAATLALVALVALAALAALAAPARAQMPEDHGSFTVMTWDPGMIPLDGVNIHVHVSYPSGGAGPFPIVGVVHGASRTAANMAEMSATFASRGFVVLAPDMPCGFTGCNHAANARQLRAMLDWGVAQSADASTPLAGLVDGTRRGLAGHSWGGLATFLAAQGDPDIDAIVVLDPNDDAAMAMAVAGTVTQPSAHLMAQVMGSCNGTNWKDTVYPHTPAPHMRLVVEGAAHCDVEQPGDALCPLVCSAGNPSLSYMFRRYAVAFLACNLQGDTSMADWVGGPSFDADLSAARIGYTDQMGLDTLPCRTGGLPDGGPPTDSGIVTMRDAGGGADAGTPGSDSGTPPGSDAGVPRMDASAGMDAGTTTGGSGGGCCSVAAGSGRDGGVLAGVAACALLVLVSARRRSR